MLIMYTTSHTTCQWHAGLMFTRLAIASLFQFGWICNLKGNVGYNVNAKQHCC